MFSKWLARCVALAALVGFVGVAGDADAAGGSTVGGVVVRAHNKGVSGATVKVAHHKHKKHKHKKKKHKKGAVNKAAVHAGHHAAHASSRGTVSGSKGKFSMHVGSGSATLVAHKRGVGSGRAHATAGGNVTIQLHKHHHAHSGANTAHAKHKHKHKPKSKGKAKGKKQAKGGTLQVR